MREEWVPRRTEGWSRGGESRGKQKVEGGRGKRGVELLGSSHKC